MAVLRESDPAGRSVEFAGITQDLAAKLPSLFALGSRENTVRAALNGQTLAAVTLTNTDWPVDYVGLTARPAYRINQASLEFRSVDPKKGWAAIFRGVVDGLWDIGMTWHGAPGVPASHVMELSWGMHRMQFTPADNLIEWGWWHLPTGELAQDSPKRRRFISELGQTRPVRMQDFRLSDGYVTGCLIHEKGVAGFPVRLPLAITVGFTGGIQTRRSQERWQQKFV